MFGQSNHSEEKACVFVELINVIMQEHDCKIHTTLLSHFNHDFCIKTTIIISPMDVVTYRYDTYGSTLTNNCLDEIFGPARFIHRRTIMVTRFHIFKPKLVLSS